MRKPANAVLAAVAVSVVATAVVLHVQRENEWAHGGDRLTVDVEVALTTEKTFDDAVVRLGVPSGQATRFIDADQTVVVRARWAGLAQPSGSFELVTLDKRLSPPRPLGADGGWNAEGATGANWAGAYEKLAPRYDWLSGVASTRNADGSVTTSFPTAAVDARATRSGTVTAWFRQWGEGPIPFTTPMRDLVVALVHVDEDGEVRWARRVYG